MRLAILGGGGFRVPLVYRALLADAGAPGACHELVLHDTDPVRLRVIASVLAAQAAGVPDAPAVRIARDLDDALRGADFVFSAIRVGGTAGRVRDERVPLAEGVLGQETVGAGGVLYGLRTLPVAVAIAERVKALAPDAWVINFTNPAGMVTEAMSRVLGERVIGICDSPVGLVRRAARAAGTDPDSPTFSYDYVGLNHLGWLRRMSDGGAVGAGDSGASGASGGEDLLPGLLANAEALSTFEEGKLFGAQWLAALGSLPNEYLHYYYFEREALAAVRASATTRGEFLDRQQGAFFSSAAGRPADAYPLWDRTRLEREETYMAENRAATGGWQRDPHDLDGGGYDRVALALMRAIARDERTTLILNVPNGTTVPSLDAEAIIEVACEVGAFGARPLPVAAPTEHQAGLMLTLKAVERAAIEAAATGSRTAALRALALHPLVDSAAVAGRILAAAQV
ncbi:6-phospho-beta-glucosidase [Streptomyces sp. H10-C2]|uniref:6-phospho-beta-glucosidase n=1 Tax=unclassified Streptomyces TaxID=2593676 RepID=UPI0024BAB13B|nr:MULTISPECIES: 6-phospho-beta-glucosidase [unclassified Streptomyces]MDJ0345820.1 6-phospho-beta-glucosidase [Streptomyces sp. PH10-H1]MDJ0374710.1 6-phospho-beta-glucosidase [Streptomyces sp. H10-C2]